MKVLMINSVCGIRSTGRICTDLAVELEKHGHDVKIAYGREDVPTEFKRFAIRIGTDLDVKLHGLKARLFDAMGFGSKRATKVFIEWVKEYDPDVIHLHNIHGYYINIEILFSYLKTCGKRIIWTLHDCWAFTGHSAYCDAVNCEKWKTGCYACPQKKVYPKSFTDKSKRNWEKKKQLFTRIPNLTLVTPSHWLEGLAKESFLNEYSVKVIHNGIDTSLFKTTESDFRKRYSLEDKGVILGVASVWEERKGFSDYLKLSEQLSDDYRIVLVGLSKEQRINLPYNIISFTVNNNTAELVRIYSASDVLFNPTYEDNYPTINLEAIACGTPVITYNTGGSPESAIFYGRIVDKGDLDTVKRIIIEKEFFKAKEYSIDKQTMIDQYIEII